MKIGALKKDPATQVVYRYTGEIDGLDEFIVNGTGTPSSAWFTDGKKIGERKMYTPTGHVYFWSGTDWVLEWFPWEPVIANGSIGTAKLDDEAVTEDKLADDSVSTNKIVDGAVTEVKIADGAVSAVKLAE